MIVAAFPRTVAVDKKKVIIASLAPAQSVMMKWFSRSWNVASLMRLWPKCHVSFSIRRVLSIRSSRHSFCIYSWSLPSRAPISFSDLAAQFPLLSKPLFGRSFYCFIFCLDASSVMSQLSPCIFLYPINVKRNMVPWSGIKVSYRE